MKRFKTINDAVYFIETQKRFTAKRDLNKFKKAFDLLELNFEKTKLIHVGGTNGKGSTTAFISNVTVGNNLKTGTFTSPYLVDFNERIKVNNKNISDEDLLDLINFFYDFNIKNELNLSFFELVTLMAFKHFHNLNCEVVIMEIGIGGRLDATNIINYDLTIITSVGYDHLKVLGNTILEIATEKVHALKENGHLISYDDTRYNELFNERAKETNSTIKLINKDLIKIGEDYNFSYKNCTFKLDLLGIYQMQNAVLAYEGIKYLFDFIVVKIK